MNLFASRLLSSHALMLAGVDPCCRPAPWERPDHDGRVPSQVDMPMVRDRSPSDGAGRTLERRMMPVFDERSDA